MVYFLQAEDSSPIKIGTTWRLSRRLKQLNQGAATPLRVMAVAPGHSFAESRIHAAFASLRIQGEWFHPGPFLLHFIANECQQWDGKDDKGSGQQRRHEMEKALGELSASGRGFTLKEAVRRFDERDLFRDFLPDFLREILPVYHILDRLPPGTTIDLATGEVTLVLG